MNRYRLTANGDMTMRRPDLRLILGLSILAPLSVLAALGPTIAHLPF